MNGNFETTDLKNIICGNPIDKYIILRPKYNLSYIVGKEIVRLQKAIFDITGKEIAILTDDCADSFYQIKIAVFGRETLPKDTYEIRTESQDIVLCGENEISCAAAVGKFITMLENGEEIHSLTATATETQDGYSLVWQDEFDGDLLDTKTWSIIDRTFESSVEGIMTCFSPRPENVSVRDGNLQMTAQYDGKQYYGCEIASKYSMWYQYGYVEISARVPGQKGMVPAFWSRGSGEQIWPEIDFFEALGTDREIKGTLLGWVGEKPRADWSTFMLCTEKFPPDATYYRIPEGENLYDDYHTIGFYWDETTAIWTCDGVEYARCDELCVTEKIKATFHTPIHLLLSMQTAVNNWGFPPPDDTTDWSKGTFLVEYVRLYQKDGQLLIKL